MRLLAGWILVMGLSFGSIAMAAITLDANSLAAPVPLTAPIFQDKTNALSAAQAQTQYARLLQGNSVQNLGTISVDRSGATYWLVLEVSNATTQDQWHLAFNDTQLVSPIKRLTVFREGVLDTPMASHMDADIDLNLTARQGGRYFVLIETWPGVAGTVMPVLTAPMVMIAQHQEESHHLLYFMLLIGAVFGTGVIQLLLNPQRVSMLLAINAALIGVAGTYLFSHDVIASLHVGTHGASLPLLCTALLGIGAAIMQMVINERFKVALSMPLGVLIGNVIFALLAVTSLQPLLALGLPLERIPAMVETVSAAVLVAAALVGVSRNMSMIWITPAWMILALLPWMDSLVLPSLYALSLLVATVALIFADWRAIAQQTSALQKRLRMELKSIKDQHDTETRDWQQRLDGERQLLNELKHLEQIRANELDIARREADTANTAKSDFLAIISHEIRTPMNGIMGIVQLMQQTPLNQKQLEYVEIIQSSGETMVTLLNDILDYSKIEKGAIDIETIPFTLRKLVNSVATLMTGRAKDKNLGIHIHVSDDVPDHLLGDPNRMRQILLNLVSNAIKFTEQGSVTIKISKTEQRLGIMIIHFDIVDTGMGIAEDVQKKLFQAYVQADASISRRFGGTGLGLNICRMLVNAMDGKIGVQSALGHGSTFWFELPLQAAPDDIAIKTVSADDYTPRQKLNVLVIDDNSVNLKVVSGLLEIDGHHVTTTSNGEQGLKLIQDHEFDLVLVDLLMPVMDGKTFAMRMRQHPNQMIARMPIYALTGLGGEDAKQAVMSAGMQGVISKPITQTTLRAVIESVAGQAPRIARQGLTQMMQSLETLSVDEKKKLAAALESNHPTLQSGPQPAAYTPNEVAMPQTHLLNMMMLADLKASLPGPTLKEIFAELIPKTRELTASMQQATAADDLKELTEHAHNLKGMAGNFGLQALMDFSGRIENAGRAEQKAEAFALVPQAPALMEETLQQLDGWLASA